MTHESPTAETAPTRAPTTASAFAPWGFLHAPLRHGDVIVRLAARAGARERRGLALGVLWALITPLAMLAVYGFVFGTVMGRGATFAAGAFGAEPAPFAVAFFAGIVVFRFFAGVLSGAPKTVIGQKHLVLGVAFPLEALPWAHMLAEWRGLLAPMGLLIAATWVLHAPPGPNALFLPVVLAPLALIALGASYGLAALGVFLRDIRMVLPPLLTGILFLSPTFYPLAAAPEAARPFLLANPISPTVIQVRAVLLHDRAPDWVMLGWQALAGLVIVWAARAFFVKTRAAFADVL